MTQRILGFIEEQSGCKCYHSFKHSYDLHSIPINEFDDSIRISVKRSGERSKIKSSVDLKGQLKEALLGPALFRYFLDGSRRTYKIDDIAIGDRMYPIIGGQIGVGCCERLDPDRFKKFHLINESVMSVPDCLDRDGKKELFYNNYATKINGLEFMQRKNLRINKLLPYSYSALQEGENYENRGIARIQDEMIEQEKKLVQYIVKEERLNDKSYLLKDGSLEYSEKSARGDKSYKLAQIKQNYRHVVGASKSFNPEKCIDDRNRSNAVKIAELPLFHRTPAYMFQSDLVPDVRFAVWYVRIRATERTTSQFDGVLKLEKVLISDDENEYGLETDEIDTISSNIINERTPVAYASDKRWANHLYPIYLTESFIKSTYISDTYFLNIF